jgi:putative transposase
VCRAIAVSKYRMPSRSKIRRRIDPDSSADRAQRQRDTPEHEWEGAREKSQDLRILEGRALSASVVNRLSQKWGVGRATIFRTLSRFKKDGNLGALLTRRGGKQLGFSHLPSEVDFVIGDCAKRLWTLSENATVEDIFTEILNECTARQLKPPSRATVGRRLHVLRDDPENFTGEAREALRTKSRLVKSQYRVDEPLAVVQIDHTVADILLVEPHTRCLVGRPTLTIAIDVATRCVLGFCASFEAPSSLLVALCLETAVFPKDGNGSSQGTVDWPMYGLMKCIHSDNGREFRGQAFRRGCDLNNINTIYRPPATPRFGGHIERLIGTFMRRTRLLPGNTYSDMLGRRPRSAESKASLTLGDYRSFLIDEVERYHNRTHRTLGTSPRSAWDRAWRRGRGAESPTLPPSPERFLIDFLPVRNRVVTREGIEVDGLRFSCGSLQSEVDPSIKRVVRIDPRDISRVYLEMRNGPYLTVPLRAGHGIPSMSWWEWRATRRRRKNGEDVANGWPEHSSAPQERKTGTALRAGRARVRKAEWDALQAIQALPLPNTKLRQIVHGDKNTSQLEWEILD